MSRLLAPQAPARSERAVLLTLAAVQFTHVMDFMIMMPLGAELMREFAIGPGQFSVLVAAYGAAAALAGLAGGFFLDRVERRQATIRVYGCFLLATLACALAPTHGTWLAARVVAGLCGGLVGSLVIACVADVVPPERRGRGMAFVMASFPVASIAGVPFALILSNRFGWHAPFYFIVVTGLPVWLAIARLLPVRTAAPEALARSALGQMRALLAEPIHWRCFAVTAAVVGASGCLIPFMAPSLVANTRVTEASLPWVYFFGGLVTFVSMPVLGRLTDRYDKLHVLAGITLPAAVAVWFVTRLEAEPFWAVIALTSLFFIGMSGRFAPSSALALNAVKAEHRGGFSALNSAVQSASVAAANLIGGALIWREATSERLLGYERVGWVSLGLFALTLVLAHRLRAMAPHAARNPAPTTR